MHFASALLYPFFALLPFSHSPDASLQKVGAYVVTQVEARTAFEGRRWVDGESGAEQSEALKGLGGISPLRLQNWSAVEPEVAQQVRIDQRLQIRVLPPRSKMPMPDMLVDMPRLGGFSTRVVQRKMGKCISASGIANVRPERENRILFIMHDRRVVSAELERSCRARDFYSGFLIDRTEDGRLCVDRDSLLSRSGVSCKLTGIKQLVEDEQ